MKLLRLYFAIAILPLWLQAQPPLDGSLAKKTALTGKEVIHKFLANQETNYSHMPLVHHAILVEKESLLSGEMLYANKAEIEYLRYGYHDYEEDLMKLVAGENTVHVDSLFEDHLYGGLAEIKKDIVKYPREFLQTKRGLYAYQLEEIIVGETDVYKVSFNPIQPKAKYQGKLYIQCSDFALVKVTYKLSSYGIDLLNKLQHSVDFEWRDINETITYKKPDVVRSYLDNDDLYYLNTIVTDGVGYHHTWRENLNLQTELSVFQTNRTRFFANEYYRIDDNVALSQLNYEKQKPASDDIRHISHAQMVAQESDLSEINAELPENANDQLEDN